MYRRSTGSNPSAPQLDFAMSDVLGKWVSRSGSPRIRIYRNDRRKKGGYYIEVTYDEKTVFHRLLKRTNLHIRYFELYRAVGLAYDAEHDILQLSAYGDYYRAEE